MGKSERLELIKSIEDVRGTRVICYLTSVRGGFDTPMAMDVPRRLFDHLRLMKDKKIDLFLVSNGGDAVVPWRLVTLIREFTEHFSVLIPYRAFSAATLTALGANEIVMHPMGMLGPTDPTVNGPHNPRDSNNNPIGIGVEDVNAYAALIREDFGIQHQDETIQAFNRLAESVKPLALGQVKRFILQSRMMAEKLLSTHMDAAEHDHKIGKIVESLTAKLFYHGHPISRREAKNDLNIAAVSCPPTEVEDVMWALYEEYEAEMKNEEPFDPVCEFCDEYPDIALEKLEITPKKQAKAAFIESRDITDTYVVEYCLSGKKLENGDFNVSVISRKRDWHRDPPLTGEGCGCEPR